MIPESVSLPALNLVKGISQLSSRLLDWDDLEMVLEFRESIFAKLPSQFRLQNPDTDDIETAELNWAKRHLLEPGLTLGVFCSQKLIGFASLLLPENALPGDASQLLGLSDAQIARSATMASCMIAPEFRGMRLQSKLLSWRKDVAAIRGRTLLVAMTACGNVYSLRNMLNIGMSIQWVGELKPSRWWQVLALDLCEQSRIDRKLQFDNHVCVQLDDFTKQAALIADHFEGIGIVLVPDSSGAFREHFEFARNLAKAC